MVLTFILTSAATTNANDNTANDYHGQQQDQYAGNQNDEGWLVPALPPGQLFCLRMMTKIRRLARNQNYF